MVRRAPSGRRLAARQEAPITPSLTHTQQATAARGAIFEERRERQDVITQFRTDPSSFIGRAGVTDTTSQLQQYRLMKIYLLE